MNLAERIDALLDLAERMGIPIRREPLDGRGGGLCVIRGKTVLFIDTQADSATRYEALLTAMARMDQIDQHYVVPELREALEQARQ